MKAWRANIHGQPIKIGWFTTEFVNATRLEPQYPPTKGIFDHPYSCFKINRQWASHVLGALESLTQRDSWLGTDEQIDLAINSIELFSASLMTECEESDTCMLRQNPLNPCELEQSTDGGETWFVIFDFSQCAVPGPAGPAGPAGQDGQDGAPGAPGQDGLTPEFRTQRPPEGGYTEIQWRYIGEGENDWRSLANIPDGAAGAAGEPGADGVNGRPGVDGAGAGGFQFDSLPCGHEPYARIGVGNTLIIGIPRPCADQVPPVEVDVDDVICGGAVYFIDWLYEIWGFVKSAFDQFGELSQLAANLIDSVPVIGSSVAFSGAQGLLETLENIQSIGVLAADMQLQNPAIKDLLYCQVFNIVRRDRVWDGDQISEWYYLNNQDPTQNPGRFVITLIAAIVGVGAQKTRFKIGTYMPSPVCELICGQTNYGCEFDVLQAGGVLLRNDDVTVQTGDVQPFGAGWTWLAVNDVVVIRPNTVRCTDSVQIYGRANYLDVAEVFINGQSVGMWGDSTFFVYSTPGNGFLLDEIRVQWGDTLSTKGLTDFIDLNAMPL